MVKYSQFLLLFYLLRLSVGNIYNDRVPNGPNDSIKVYGRRLLRPYDRRQIRSLISGSLEVQHKAPHEYCIHPIIITITEVRTSTYDAHERRRTVRQPG